MEYLFKAWDNLKTRIEKGRILLFLDYDGTLAPIAESPRKAVMPPETKRLLYRLAGLDGFSIVVISGRAIEDIRAKVGMENIIYSGNHGLEVAGPRINCKLPLPASYRRILSRIKSHLIKKTSLIKGVLVEDKGITLSLHYRLVRKKDAVIVKGIFYNSIKKYMQEKSITVRPGKMVLEIRPPVKWDKGKTVLWLLARQRFIAKGTVSPIYIGDDATDEDAFKALKGKGITIFVGRPKASYAEYYLRDTREARRLLKHLLELRRSSERCRK